MKKILTKFRAQTISSHMSFPYQIRSFEEYLEHYKKSIEAARGFLGRRG